MTDLGEAIVAAVAPHSGVRSIQLVGSRAEGRATDRSDWDFRVEADDLAALVETMPELLAQFQPLAQQWDRLSPEYCWMVILRGPVKVDLIFSDKPHEKEPPWKPQASNLEAIDDHFWDWMLWLRSKEAADERELVDAELTKLFAHLLAPLGVSERPGSIADAVASYRAARRCAERRFGRSVRRDVEAAVAPALGGQGLR
ncbi:MAG: nucleotidyltransferase domain-containing protein [Gaiellaceae bacterium]